MKHYTLSALERLNAEEIRNKMTEIKISKHQIDIGVKFHREEEQESKRDLHNILVIQKTIEFGYGIGDIVVNTAGEFKVTDFDSNVNGFRGLKKKKDGTWTQHAQFIIFSSQRIIK